MQDAAGSLSVLGAGSYGTALSIAAASRGRAVMLYCRSPDQAQRMERERQNARYLPGITFPQTLHVTASLEEAAHFSPNLLVVVPSAAFRDMVAAIVPFLHPGQGLAWATKGLDVASGRLLSEVAEELMGRPARMVSLSGPTFARELALGLPTAIAAAGTDREFCLSFCELLHTPTFRIYENSDMIALQLGGAVKNVIAIAAGLSDGLGFGANARTALISRGLAEMVRLGLRLGASERGFMGLSGLGDLILTCTDDQSRNRRYGYMLGQGKSTAEALAAIGQVVEGHEMVRVVHELGQRHGIALPITNELYEVIVNHRPGLEAAHSLLSRARTAE